MKVRVPGPEACLWINGSLNVSSMAETAPRDPPQDPSRPLATKALSEAYGRLRFRDTSLLIWQQQQEQFTPPSTYLSRSQSTWYGNNGNQAVLVPYRRTLEGSEGQSRICALM